MHLSRVGLDKESAIMGSMALTLGAVMVLGAVCGAAGIMVREKYREKVQVSFEDRASYYCDAVRDCRTRLAKPKFQARTGTKKK